MNETNTGLRVSFGNIAFDCREPDAMARFYAGLLGGQIDPDPEGDWVTVHWDGPDLAFQLAPDHESPRWPEGEQQAHIDFTVADIRAAHARVLELGGRALDPPSDPQPGDDRGFRVYADPAGHPFCLCRPDAEAWR